MSPKRVIIKIMEI